MTKIERVKLIAFAIGLSLLLIMRDVFDVRMSKYLYLAYAVVFFAIARYQTLVYMICFTTPLLCGLPGTYIMSVALVLLIAKSKQINLWQISLIVAVAAMEVFASAWYPKSDTAAIVQYIAYIGVMFFLIHDRTDMDHTISLRMYLFATCVLCMIIITAGIIKAPSDWMKLLASGHFRFGGTHYSTEADMTLILNANGLGFFSAAGVCIGILLADRCKGMQRIWTIVLTVLAGSGGLMSISRTWVLVVGICLFFYVMGKVRHPRRLLAVALVCGIVVLCVFMIAGEDSELMEAIMEAFDTRMSDDNMSTANGRTELFLYYMDVFFSDAKIFLFGTGVTQYKAVTGNVEAIHNSMQQILVCCGLSGFVIYMFGMFQPVFANLRKGKKPIVYWIPFIGILLYMQTSPFLNMEMMLYMVGVFALKSGVVKREEIRRYS